MPCLYRFFEEDLGESRKLLAELTVF